MPGSSCGKEGMNREAVLAVIPKNELALAEKNEAARAERFDKTARRMDIVSVAGVIAVSLAAISVHLVPVVAPILFIPGFIFGVGAGPAGIIARIKRDHARNRQAKAEQRRCERLVATARAALEEAISDNSVRLGRDLLIVPQDETPKVVRVRDVEATVSAHGEKKLRITATILEEDRTSVTCLKGDQSSISGEYSVRTFPEGVLEPLRAALISDHILTPPDSLQMPDKRLPRINTSLSLRP